MKKTHLKLVCIFQQKCLFELQKYDRVLSIQVAANILGWSVGLKVLGDFIICYGYFKIPFVILLQILKALILCI